MNEFTVEEQNTSRGAKIKVIGCGGGGGNMLNFMINSGLTQVDLIAANTDVQALGKSLAKTHIQLGEKKTKGLGAGMNPEIGAESAKESYEKLKQTLEGSDMVFLATGLGGGTGTGATPVVAQAAKEIGALTVAVVTMPFDFEGKKRRKLADAGLLELKKECDSIIVIYNQRLLGFMPPQTDVIQAYAKVDEILTRATKGMTSVLLDESYINVDFADIRTVMGHRGLALMGIGSGSGEHAMDDAIVEAVQSPLFDGMSLDGAKGVIAHFKTSRACTLFDIAAANDQINSKANEDATYVYGHSIDDTMEDRVEITIIATGFEDENEEKAHNDESLHDVREKLISIRKTSGGDYDEAALDQLDYPTFLRRQAD